jgi:hypothetical protein
MGASAGGATGQSVVALEAAAGESCGPYPDIYFPLAWITVLMVSNTMSKSSITDMCLM